MNFARIALAAGGGMVAYFAAGTAIFFLVPQIIEESRKKAALFRSKEDQMSGMPALMIATLVAIAVLAVLFAMIYPNGAGPTEAVHFGVLIAVFVVCAFVVHNFATFNIGAKLALMQAGAHFVQWTTVGTVVGLLCKGG